MAWGLAQSASGTQGVAATTFSLAFAAGVTLNNRILVAVTQWQSPAANVTGVTDGAGNAYRLVARIAGTDGTDVTLWDAVVAAGGGTLLNVTATAATASSSWAMIVREYSGLTTATTSYLDGTASAAAVSGNASSGASSPVATASNELAVGVYGDSGNNTVVSAGAGWGDLLTTGASLTATSAMEDQNSTNAAGSTATFTQAPNTGAWSAIVAVFKLAGGTPRSQSLTVTSSTVPTIRKAIGKAASVQSTTAVALVRQLGKAVAVQSVTLASLSKRVGKAVSVQSATLPSLLKQLGKVATAQSATAATLVALKGKGVVLAVTSSTVASMVRQVGKNLIVQGSTAPSMARQIGKAVQVTSTTLPAVRKAIGKAVAALSNTLASAVAGLAAPATFGITSAYDQDAYLVAAFDADAFLTFAADQDAYVLLTVDADAFLVLATDRDAFATGIYDQDA